MANKPLPKGLIELEFLCNTVSSVKLILRTSMSNIDTVAVSGPPHSFLYSKSGGHRAGVQVEFIMRQTFAHWTRVKIPLSLKKASPFPVNDSAPESSIMTLLSVALLTLSAS